MSGDPVGGGGVSLDGDDDPVPGDTDHERRSLCVELGGKLRP